MKVLLTGAAGFLGRATYACLAQAGHTVIPMGHEKTYYPDQIIIDLENATAKTMDQLPVCDAIIHLAGKVDFRQGFNEGLYKVNTIGSMMLAQAAKRRDAKYVFSSMATIAGVNNPFISASSPPAPDIPYALGKWIAEAGIIAITEDHVILRFGGIFGLNGPSHLGLNNTIRNALNGELPQIKGTGNARRNYIYVKDAVEAIRYCLEKDIKGLHLVAGTEVLSIRKMLELICSEYTLQGKPKLIDGAEAQDQIIEPSGVFPKTRAFTEALRDIKKDYEKSSGN